MSCGRFFSKYELEYEESFDNSGYVLDMFTYEDGYEKLLKKAIKEKKALTREDFISLYGLEGVELLESLAHAHI